MVVAQVAVVGGGGGVAPDAFDVSTLTGAAFVNVARGLIVGFAEALLAMVEQKIVDCAED